MENNRRCSSWLLLHMGLGLLWIGGLASRADGGAAWQIMVMLLAAGWLPSAALAGWQVNRRRWRSLLASDLLGSGVLVLMACTVYVPLFFINVAWFLPMALLPRGVLTEVGMRCFKECSAQR